MRLTFEDWRGHVVPRTCGSGEPMVEVPKVADGQQKHTDISVVTNEDKLTLPRYG